jgi:hypothetical protein
VNTADKHQFTPCVFQPRCIIMLFFRYDSTCYIGFNGAVSSLLFAIETQMTIGA